MSEPQTVDPSQIVDQRFAQSANPAADIAASVLTRMFAPQAAPAAQPAPVAQPAAQPAYTPPSVESRYAIPDPNQPPEVPTLPDIPPEQDVRLPDNTAENIGHAFATVRAEVRKYKQLAEEFKAQVEKVRGDYANYAQRESAITEKLAAEQRRAADLEERLGKLDLTQSPAFRQKYDAPIESIRAAIAQTLVQNGLQQQAADELAKSVVLADNATQVPQLPGVSELPAAVQGMLMYKFNEADALWAQRNQAITDWRATRTGLEQTQVREDAVVSAQRRSELANASLDVLSRIVPQFVWADPAFEQLRTTEVDKVKAWYGQAKDEQIAAAAIEGALVAPYAYKLIEGLSNKVLELQGVIDARTRAAHPTVSPYFMSPTPPPPPPPKPGEGDEKRSWSEAAPSSPSSMAAALVGDSLKKMMGQ